METTLTATKAREEERVGSDLGITLLARLEARKKLLASAAELERQNLVSQIRELGDVMNPDRNEGGYGTRTQGQTHWLSLLSALWSGWSFFRRKPARPTASASSGPHWKDWLVGLGQVALSMWVNSAASKRRSSARTS